MIYLTTHSMRALALLAMSAVLFTSCKKCDEPMPDPVEATPPPPFYGDDFLGHYDSESVFANGSNVTSIVKVRLDLQLGSGQFEYKESNPFTGSAYTESLNMTGGWNMNATHDTLFFQTLTGSHQEVKTVETSTGDGGTSTSYETVTVYDYQNTVMPFHLVSPNKFLLERTVNGSNQQYHLVRW